MKKQNLWFSINIIKNQLFLLKNKYCSLIVNNGPINNISKGIIDKILNIINYNEGQFIILGLNYEDNIVDANAPIIIDEQTGIDLDTYEIYNNYWLDKAKLLSKYM